MSEILVPVAGLPQGRPTLDYAGLLARRLGLGAAVLSVAPGAWQEEAARRTAEEAAAGLEGARVVVRVGDPAVEILAEAGRPGYGFLVVGPRDRPGLREALLGTVAQRLVERSPLPTVVVAPGRLALDRILVATGGRRWGQAAIRAGSELARAVGARMAVLHVAPSAPGMYAGLRTMEERLEDLLGRDTEEARHLHWAARHCKEEGVAAEIVLRHGVVEDEILQELGQGDYDLLVLGRLPPVGPLPRLLMGSLAPEVVVRSPVPVLVVPAAG